MDGSLFIDWQRVGNASLSPEPRALARAVARFAMVLRACVFKVYFSNYTVLLTRHLECCESA